MQSELIASFDKRMVFYAAKAYAEQLKQVVSYPILCPVVVVAVVDFVMFPQKQAYKSIHEIRGRVSGENDIKELVFAFIELKKFKKQEHELQTNEDRWLFFLKEISRKEELPGALAQNEFADACHTLEKEAWPDDERDAYEKAFILQTDARGKIIAAEGKALAMGIEKGM